MYRWVDHTAELELHLGASSEPDLFAEALRALAELLAGEDVDGGERGGDPVSHAVSVSATDHATLLAEWLNELVYLAETRGLIPERAQPLRLAEQELDAVVHGRAGEPHALVKAVTYHRLGIWHDADTWRARVVFDV